MNSNDKFVTIFINRRKSIIVATDILKLIIRVMI